MDCFVYAFVATRLEAILAPKCPTNELLALFFCYLEPRKRCVLFFISLLSNGTRYILFLINNLARAKRFPMPTCFLIFKLNFAVYMGQPRLQKILPFPPKN